jgi:hypothetical protein
VKPQTINKVNEMFLPGWCMAIVFYKMSSFALLLPVPNLAKIYGNIKFHCFEG